MQVVACFTETEMVDDPPTVFTFDGVAARLVITGRGVPPAPAGLHEASRPFAASARTGTITQPINSRRAAT